MVTTTVFDCDTQGDRSPVEASLSVTVPAVISASDGVYVAFKVVSSG